MSFLLIKTGNADAINPSFARNCGGNGTATIRLLGADSKSTMPVLQQRFSMRYWDVTWLIG
jgi:hypothetical protein